MAGGRRAVAVSEHVASFEGISSVSKLSLPEQVFLSLRDALMCGRFAPGQRVPLRSIATALGTSTMPAREAVNRLVAMEALEYLPNRRVSVPILTVEKYRDLSIARSIIEPAAAERATSELTDADLQALIDMHKIMNQLLQRSDQDGNVQDYIKMDKAFFFRIYAANKSPILMSTIESFWLKTGPYLNVIVDDRNRNWFEYDSIKPVLEALLSRDKTMVKQAVFDNIQNAAKFILEHDKLGRGEEP